MILFERVRHPGTSGSSMKLATSGNAGSQFISLLLLMLFLQNQNLFAQVTSLCDSIPGKWSWFTGHIVTIQADGTLVHDPGNDGTWQCMDGSRGEVIIQWRIGGYVNQVALTPDRNGLFSIDPSQSFVKATRIQPAPTPTTNPTPTPTPAPTPTPVPTPQGTSPEYKISPEDSKELARLVKRMNGDYTYTKQVHWPDGSVSDDGYVVATMSLTLGEDLILAQRYLKCRVSNPGWRTDGYVISSNTPQDCDKNLQGLKWEETIESAPAAQIEPSSIQITEIDQHDSGANLALTFGYVGYDPAKTFEFKEEEEEGNEYISYNPPPGFTILRCRNRGTCGQMAGDLDAIVGIAKKYASIDPAAKP